MKTTNCKLVAPTPLFRATRRRDPSGWPGPGKRSVASIDATLCFAGPGQRSKGSRRLVASTRRFASLAPVSGAGRRVGRDVSPGPGQPEGSRRLVALKRGVGGTNYSLVSFPYLSRGFASRFVASSGLAFFPQRSRDSGFFGGNLAVSNPNLATRLSTRPSLTNRNQLGKVSSPPDGATVLTRQVVADQN